jgi:hypothetical protein
MKGKSGWGLPPELEDSLVENKLGRVFEDHVQMSYEFY